MSPPTKTWWDTPQVDSEAGWSRPFLRCLMSVALGYIGDIRGVRIGWRRGARRSKLRSSSDGCHEVVPWEFVAKDILTKRPTLWAGQKGAIRRDWVRCSWARLRAASVCHRFLFEKHNMRTEGRLHRTRAFNHCQQWLHNCRESEPPTYLAPRVDRRHSGHAAPRTVPWVHFASVAGPLPPLFSLLMSLCFFSCVQKKTWNLSC